ncbi:MAG: hypothetical protein AAGB32_02530 [Pseudomonadota bacterium]
MKKQTILSLSSLGLLSVSLGACMMAHPNPIPTGYTYHHDTYKSAAPPLSNTITTQQRRYMDEEQATQFRDGTYALLEGLTMRAGMPPKPIYVLAPNPMTNFYANIDNDLRDNMRHIGYALSDTPDDAYIFTYDASYIAPTDGTYVEGQPNVELTLRVFNEISETGRMLSEETGRFYIKGAETLKIQPTRYGMLPTPENTKPDMMEKKAEMKEGEISRTVNY